MRDKGPAAGRATRGPSPSSDLFEVGSQYYYYNETLLHTGGVEDAGRGVVMGELPGTLW